MPLDDELVAVYFGEDTDSLFLKTLLEGSGIPASLRGFSVSDAVFSVETTSEYSSRAGMQGGPDPWSRISRKTVRSRNVASHLGVFTCWHRRVTP
jgi:hypothetical protein